MKKKVGELYDKPIVIGNPNEFTKNEIALSKLGGSNGGSNNIKYYNLPNDTKIKQMMPIYSTLIKVDGDAFKVIYGIGQIMSMLLMDEDFSLSEIAESFVSCAVDFDALFSASPEEGEVKIKDILLPEVISSIGLIEITKEEFYNLNA